MQCKRNGSMAVHGGFDGNLPLCPGILFQVERPTGRHISLRMLGPDEAHVLDRVARDVFDFNIDPRWTAEFFADPRHHIAVAIVDGVVVGMATAVHYVHPDKAPALWINEVGVAPPHQRHGIGRRLLEVLFEHGRSLGCGEAWLGTEVENTPARRLYSAAGGKELPMMFFTFGLNED